MSAGYGKDKGQPLPRSVTPAKKSSKPAKGMMSVKAPARKAK
jgi:hypothetical protein